MSVEHIAVVLHHSRAKGTAKLVLIGIANHMGDGGAWPSVATLAKYANVEPRNVNVALQKLQSLGEVRVHVQQGGTRATEDHRRPNRYDVLVQCPPWCDKTPNHRDQRRYIEQPGLWTNRVTDSSAPDGTVTPPPDGTVTPPPDGTVTRTSTTNQQPEPRLALVPQLQDTRADCSECGLPASDCIQRAKTSGHAYKPRRRDPAAIVARIHDQYTEESP